MTKQMCVLIECYRSGKLLLLNPQWQTNFWLTAPSTPTPAPKHTLVSDMRTQSNDSLRLDWCNEVIGGRSVP